MVELSICVENGGWYFLKQDRLGGFLNINPAIEDFVFSFLGDVYVVVGWEGSRKLSLPGWGPRGGQCPCS